MSDNQSHKTQIIVALIGMIGVVAAAVVPDIFMASNEGTGNPEPELTTDKSHTSSAPEQSRDKKIEPDTVLESAPVVTRGISIADAVELINSKILRGYFTNSIEWENESCMVKLVYYTDFYPTVCEIDPYQLVAERDGVRGIVIAFDNPVQCKTGEGGRGTPKTLDKLTYKFEDASAALSALGYFETWMKPEFCP